MDYRQILESVEPLTPETRCGYCRFPFSKNPFGRMAFHADHIIPKVKAPHLSTVVSNLVWACIRCNLKKRDFMQGHDPVTNQLVPLYHPRNQIWPAEFQGLSNGKINGRTPTGRGTESRLQFNDDIIVVLVREEGFSDGWWPAIDQG